MTEDSKSLDQHLKGVLTEGTDKVHVAMSAILEREFDETLLKKMYDLARVWKSKFKIDNSTDSLPYHTKLTSITLAGDMGTFAKALGFEAKEGLAVPSMPDFDVLKKAKFMQLDKCKNNDERIAVWAAFIHVLAWVSIELGNLTQSTINKKKIVESLNSYVNTQTGSKYSPISRAVSSLLQISFKKSDQKNVKDLGMLLISSSFGVVLTILQASEDVKNQWYNGIKETGNEFIAATSKNATSEIVARGKLLLTNETMMKMSALRPERVKKVINLARGSPEFKSSALGAVTWNEFEEIRKWSHFTNLVTEAPDVAKANQGDLYRSYETAKALTEVSTSEIGLRKRRR